MKADTTNPFKVAATDGVSTLTYNNVLQGDLVAYAHGANPQKSAVAGTMSFTGGTLTGVAEVIASKTTITVGSNNGTVTSPTNEIDYTTTAPSVSN